MLIAFVPLQHNKQREEWHRLKEKNPRLAAKIEAKAAGADGVESDTDKEEESSDDEEEDEVNTSSFSHI